jgi:hypothetical protein
VAGAAGDKHSWVNFTWSGGLDKTGRSREEADSSAAVRNDNQRKKQIPPLRCGMTTKEQTGGSAQSVSARHG